MGERDPALLALVRQCAIERDRWDLAYGQALQGARDGGYSLAEIARAAGVSKQAVLKMTRRPPTPVTVEKPDLDGYSGFDRGGPTQVVEPPWEER